jgi:hypothetical protein
MSLFEKFSEKEQNLFNKYPDMFRRVNLHMRETCMCWGADIPDEWFPEVEALCDAIQQIEPNCVEFEQIKVKYGGIRIYYDVVKDITTEQDKEISNLVDRVEQKCYDKKYVY